MPVPSDPPRQSENAETSDDDLDIAVHHIPPHHEARSMAQSNEQELEIKARHAHIRAERALARQKRDNMKSTMEEAGFTKQLILEMKKEVRARKTRLKKMLGRQGRLIAMSTC